MGAVIAAGFMIMFSGVAIGLGIERGFSKLGDALVDIAEYTEKCRRKREDRC